MSLMQRIFFPEHTNAQNSSKLFKGLIVIFRLIQLIWLIVVVGFAGHVLQGTLTSDPENTHSTASSIAIAALVIIVTATIYTLSTLVAFWSRTFRFYRGMFLGDAAICVLFLAASAVLGYTLDPNQQCPSDAAEATTASSLEQWLRQAAGSDSKDSVIVTWAYSSRANCMLARALWGSCVSLAVMYLFSGILLAFLWRNDVSGSKPSEKGGA